MTLSELHERTDLLDAGLLIGSEWTAEASGGQLDHVPAPGEVPGDVLQQLELRGHGHDGEAVGHVGPALGRLVEGVVQRLGHGVEAQPAPDGDRLGGPRRRHWPDRRGRPGARVRRGDREGYRGTAQLPAKPRSAGAVPDLAGLPDAEVAAITGGGTDAARRAAADGIKTLRATYLARTGEGEGQ